MVTEDPLDLVRRHALSLPNTTMRVLKGNPHFIVNAGTFVYVSENSLIAKLAPDDSRRLIAGGKVRLFRGEHSSRYGDWVEVELGSAGRQLLTELVDLAYNRGLAQIGIQSAQVPSPIGRG